MLTAALSKLIFNIKYIDNNSIIYYNNIVNYFVFIKYDVHSQSFQKLYIYQNFII